MRKDYKKTRRNNQIAWFIPNALFQKFYTIRGNY